MKTTLHQKKRLIRRRKDMLRRHGFTLVEVLLVVAILGILAGVVVVSTRNRVPATQISAARMSIQSLGTAIDAYEVDNGTLPATIQNLVTKGSEMNWVGPYIKTLPMDPWGQPFAYTREGDTYKIVSGGPDGQIGTGDDITSN